LELGRPLKEQKGRYLEKLARFVIEKSALYAELNQRNPQSVFTIIEFITKRTASDFLKQIKQCNRFFDDVYILSGTILEPQKQKIIKQLKSASNREKNILLITTQVVEAGVDIDMDLGFKDVSLIDSEEQIAGRVNRNASKKGCKLYLFDCDSEKFLYGNDARLQVVEPKNTLLYKNILESKDFDFLYDIIMTNINESNQSMFKQNIQNFSSALKYQLYFFFHILFAPAFLQAAQFQCYISYFLKASQYIHSFYRHKILLPAPSFPYRKHIFRLAQLS